MEPLWKLLGVTRGLTAVIGSGGKTSLLYELAEELRPCGTVLLATTTHIMRPPQYPFAGTAEELAAQYGVAFLYRDFRPGFREGQRQARELGFYMQKYCGCVFSEEERYAKAIARDMQEPEKHL